MTWVIPIWVKAINLQPVWEAIWCPWTDAACHNFTTNLKKKMSKFLVKSWKISCFWQQDYLFPDIFIPIFNFFIWYNFTLKHSFPFFSQKNSLFWKQNWCQNSHWNEISLDIWVDDNIGMREFLSKRKILVDFSSHAEPFKWKWNFFSPGIIYLLSPAPCKTDIWW